ncbi:hypothetical protein BAS10_18525 [Elizabethkingia meningoseptica]|uniref:hypothetical protein n=1 Tax=Elizabethkingia meningoseptica TaxID=238 RepID=UPI00099A979D|nr:hypothetical protein [Elizabethkingia meningoseptica]OPC01939.1 hypothetical protein BAS10_18525 [Elizabethkingia meningoseptica]
MFLLSFKKGVKNIFQKLEKLLNEIFGFEEEVADHASTPAERRVKDKQAEQARRLELKSRRNEIKKLDVERRKRIKKFWKDGYDPDPTFSIWGSGKVSHPELWKSIMDDLVSKGCEISYGERNLTYGPHPSGGLPGKISMTEEASITALMHERKHFLDDLEMGFPGWRILEDPKLVWRMEYNAYMIEIKFLRENKEFTTAQKLLKNALEEKKRIETSYQIKL